MDEKNKLLSERVKKRREQLKLSQEELALKMGYKSRSSINKIENGRAISQKIIVRLAEILDVSIFWLMGFSDKIEPFNQNKKESSQTEKIRYEITVKLEKLELNELIMVNSIIDSYLTNKKE